MSLCNPTSMQSSYRSEPPYNEKLDCILNLDPFKNLARYELEEEYIRKRNDVN
ncbi:hypothetical protein CWI39_0417p0010 [Hamiltosporidium magnivora]|uniref:Uncharacterized protein n=1 Tax=Hamiltosporidium magnivora TaxID=148818 RepID=A0A4Q9LHZ7_9MICR|nr:hypothetical protein CWI39_0417p0010 [Hamiltosporidium magnivora]